MLRQSLLRKATSLTESMKQMYKFRIKEIILFCKCKVTTRIEKVSEDTVPINYNSLTEATVKQTDNIETKISFYGKSHKTITNSDMIA